MATRNKRKLAALNKDNCKEHPGSNLTQNSNAPRSQEDYMTQVSEKVEGMVTKRLSKKPHGSHSGGLSEPIEYKPGNERERLPERSSS